MKPNQTTKDQANLFFLTHTFLHLRECETTENNFIIFSLTLHFLDFIITFLQEHCWSSNSWTK